jgi:ABC-type ATPase involved in cell division
MTLALTGVSKVVNGQTHIYPTDLTLENGTMNVLLGPTSSGKTSLMRLMAGLDVPTSGKIMWQGEDVTGMRVQDRRIAMVYQQFINYPSMTVYDNIASPMRLLGKSGAEVDAAVRKTADLMQLGPMLQRKPLELSGGQQQRCALARALVKDAGLSQDVEMRTNVSDAERSQLLGACAALVYTPEKEHFGIAPIEAMEAGRPVIAVRSGGPCETVLHGQTGWLCQPTPEEFGKAYAEVVQLAGAHAAGANNKNGATQAAGGPAGTGATKAAPAGSPAEGLRQMGTAARRRIEAHFSRAVFGRKLEAHLLDAVVGNAHTQGAPAGRKSI